MVFILGSGHFVEMHELTHLATVSYGEQSRQVAVSPLVDGNLRVQIVDLCLFTDNPTESIIRISGAHSILLQVRDKVQIYTDTVYT